MRTCSFLGDQKGVAITIVMVVLAILAMLAAYSLNTGYSRKRITDAASGTRAKVYYRAQAGVVDAMTRIRKDHTGGLVPGGSFTQLGYNPGPYNIDVDGNGRMDATVDIEPVIGGRREIKSMGLDPEL